MDQADYSNPFRPGAGHMPPYLAGRRDETAEFERLLKQDTILENLVLTGLRGVGKTVLLDTFKPLAIECRWLWANADLSEAASISETSLATRLLTDLSVVTSGVTVRQEVASGLGFRPETTQTHRLNFAFLERLFEQTPGLVEDKLKAVLETVWTILRKTSARGIIFAYDEAQNLTDHAGDRQYPLSMLLDVFQSIQRKNIPFMLVLAGLPTLFPQLVDARTFAERMFRVVFLERLSDADSREAILRPIEDADCPVKLDADATDLIVRESGGYPYFIQFICREVYDALRPQLEGGGLRNIPMEAITRKLDADFFAGRWSRVTDRQREFLWVIAELDSAGEEFSVQQIVAKAEELLERGFGPSQANRMLVALAQAGLVYKNRHGRYSFAIPLLAHFIKRWMRGHKALE